MVSVAETLAAASPWYPPLVPAVAAALAALAAQPKSTANAAAVDLLVLEQPLKLARSRLPAERTAASDAKKAGKLASC